MKVVVNIDRFFGAVTVQAYDDANRQLPDSRETVFFVWNTLLDGVKLWRTSMIESSDKPDYVSDLLTRDLEDVKLPIKIFTNAQDLIDNRFKEKPTEAVIEPKTEPLQ
jgi:hypothetical protein